MSRPTEARPGAAEPGWLLPLALAGLASLPLPGCGGGPRPNVLLVVIDTGRADRFSFNGYARQTSPEIAILASEGAVYEQARTPAPWTLPAHASLFTGLYPSAHGADSGHLKLDDRYPTLAEAFRGAGYRTAGYAANPWVGRQYGLDRGFDGYEELWKGKPAWEPDAGAGRVNARVTRWLEWRRSTPAARQQPFFMFINYLEPHLPYDPPDPERTRMLSPGADPLAVERLRRFKHPDEVKFVLGLGGLGPADLPLLSDLYDGEIAYVDRRVGELARLLRQEGLLDDTVVVVTSDHGEAIGDHGFLDHKMNLYEELLRIPLVVRYPRAVPAGQRIGQPVMLQDLFPTLLELAGIRGGGQGAPGTPGSEAVPLPGIRGIVPAPRRAAPAPGPDASDPDVLAGEFARPIQFLEIIQQRFPEARTAPWDRALVAFRVGREKLHWASDGRHRLYDLEKDPLEKDDLAPSRPERVAALAARVETWLRRPASRPPLRLPDPTPSPTPTGH
jgi:arylsulfatase A-like enzyme